ncbi:glycosyltransferase family 2 protein [Bacteroidota bacterium]
MNFADEYLQKHSIRNPFINEAPDPDLRYVIAIPAYKESRLTRCLDSLFLCDQTSASTEVIVLINQPESADELIINANQNSYQSALTWINQYQRKKIRFHVVLVNDLPKKHFGAGLARKLVMDEAVRRLNQVQKPMGIIISLDADTTVESNYLSALEKHFTDKPEASGCSIQFKHPLEGDEFPQEVYRSIRNYETHLRYYLAALRYTGYPYAYHTVGSCFAVRADIYCQQGGMSKRKAGEDFYFIQKVAMQGKYSECNETTVYPSPRPSDRVPFGTGPEISKQLKNPNLPYLSFAPDLFEHLKVFYANARQLVNKSNTETFLFRLNPHLQSFLDLSEFAEQMQEIRSNVATESAFYQRFLRKYNMFWILKYLHYAEEKGVHKVEVELAMKILQKKLQE